MQQPMPSFPASNITTEQIQKYLDDNKKLILAIMENQNLGKLQDCAHYQALLQKNLMYLAAIADAQPQGPAMMASQMSPHPVMQQQGGLYMQQQQQHPQQAAAAQQPVFNPKGPLQYNNQHPMHDLQQMHQHHPQGVAGQMGMRPTGANNNMNPVQPDASRGPPQAKAQTDVRGGNKQDAPDGGISAADGPRSSATGKGSRDGEAK